MNLTGKVKVNVRQIFLPNVVGMTTVIGSFKDSE
jgi:hypothetical protein